MRFLAALFFFFTFPLVVFFATILYGGFSAPLLKEQLSKANVYETLTNKLKDSFNQGTEDGSAAFIGIAEQRLTSSYVQQKAETLIDDTSSWMSNKTQIPPVISFKEIKADILAQNPGLLTQVESMIQEARKAKAEAAGNGTEMSREESANFDNQLNMLQSLVTSDFSIPIGKNLTGLKQFHDILQIATPILMALLIGSLLLIVLLSQTLKAKLRWISVVLLLSAGYGLLLVLGNVLLTKTTENIILQNQNPIVMAVSPIATSILEHFVNQYTHYQIVTSIAFTAIAIVCFIFSFVLASRPTSAPAIKKVRKKK